MAYNNFPQTYNPYGSGWRSPMEQPLYSTAQPQQEHNNPIIWVQGENAAKSYVVRPNSTVPLWDSEQQTIYLKSADASGMPSMRTIDYTFRDGPNNNIGYSTANKVVDGQAREVNYATKDDFNNLSSQIASLTETINNMAQNNHNYTKNKKEYDNAK